MTKELRDVDVSGIYYVADENTYFAEVAFSISDALDQGADAGGFGTLPPVFTVTVNVQINGNGSESFGDVRNKLIEEGKALLRIAVLEGENVI